MSLDFFKFYQRCLIPLTPAPGVTEILTHYLFGTETTDDFSKVIAHDNEIQHWIRLTVARLGFQRSTRNFNQMVELLGQNRVRDVIIGRHIERQFVPAGETVLALTQKKGTGDATKEGAKKDAKKDAKEDATKKEAAEDTIPNLADFNRYLEFANQAEQIASAIRNSYPGQAYAGGVLFDHCKYFLRNTKTDELTDERLKKTDKFVEEVFKDGIRCGIAANEIMQKISIAHQKTVFVTALVHNIGKILLLAYDPPAFEKAFGLAMGTEDKPRQDSIEVESEIFDLDHASAGALYLGRVPFLSEIERSIDFHHNPHLLKFSNPPLFALSCILKVSGGLVKLYESRRKTENDIQNLPDQKLTAREEFQFLKLAPEEWAEIKGNYVLKLLKVGL